MNPKFNLGDKVNVNFPPNLIIQDAQVCEIHLNHKGYSYDLDVPTLQYTLTFTSKTSSRCLSSSVTLDNVTEEVITFA